MENIKEKYLNVTKILEDLVFAVKPEKIDLVEKIPDIHKFIMDILKENKKLKEENIRRNIGYIKEMNGNIKF